MWPAFDGEDRDELRRVTTEFGSMYGRFIRDGSPGGSWPAFDEQKQSVLWFGKEVEPRERLLLGERNIFASHGFGSVDALEQRLASNLDAAFKP